MRPVRLDGERIYLREVSVSDALALQRVLGDPMVCETLIFEPKTLEDTREYLAEWEVKVRLIPRVHYYMGVVHRETGELIGAAYLGLIGVTEDDVHSGMLGGALRSDTWGQSFATESAQLLVKYGFEHLNLRRVWGSCGPESTSSIKLMEKMGLKYEARLRDHRLNKGVWRDSLVYAITAQDWADAKAA